MKCPECSNEMKKGVIKAMSAGSFSNSVSMLEWYSEEENKKKLFKKSISLKTTGEAFYCDECMKVFACFEEK